MRPEELLAAALRGEAAPWHADARDASESTLLDAARQHGVTALVASSAAADCWPGTIQCALRAGRRDEAVREAVKRDDLCRLQAAFEQAGVHSLLVKGAQLAYTHYPQPWLRPRFDTDVLVAPDDRLRADGALRALGYMPSHQVTGSVVAHQLQYQRHDRYGFADTIDLHWKVTNPHVFADVLTFDELAAAARPIPALGPHARGPSSVHALLLACVHRVAHHQNSDLLIWLYDIHLLFGALDADEREEFLEVARIKRLRSVCASGLDSAARWLGTRLPEAYRDRLETGVDEEREPSAAFLQPGMRRVDILRSDLRAVGGWRRKVRLIREHLFPPAAYVRARYGPNTPLVFAYLDRVLTGVGKWFRAPS